MRVTKTQQKPRSALATTFLDSHEKFKVAIVCKMVACRARAFTCFQMKMVDNMKYN